MNNQNYTTNEYEFYTKFYTLEELKANYTFHELMALYLFGMNTLKKINTIIEDELFDEVGATPMEVHRDKTIFTVKAFVVKTAIESLESCEILTTNKSMFVVHNN